MFSRTNMTCVSVHWLSCTGVVGVAPNVFFFIQSSCALCHMTYFSIKPLLPVSKQPLTNSNSGSTRAKIIVCDDHSYFQDVILIHPTCSLSISHPCNFQFAWSEAKISFRIKHVLDTRRYNLHLKCNFHFVTKQCSGFKSNCLSHIS